MDQEFLLKIWYTLNFSFILDPVINSIPKDFSAQRLLCTIYWGRMWLKDLETLRKVLYWSHIHNVHVLMSGETGENPCRHRENMQTPHRYLCHDKFWCVCIRHFQDHCVYYIWSQKSNLRHYTKLKLVFILTVPEVVLTGFMWNSFLNKSGKSRFNYLLQFIECC